MISWTEARGQLTLCSIKDAAAAQGQFDAGKGGQLAGRIAFQNDQISIFSAGHPTDCCRKP